VNQQERDTHGLEGAEGRKSQDMERTQVNDGHSPTRKHKRRDNSGHERRGTSEEY
jgi:hypothetical protein